MRSDDAANNAGANGLQRVVQKLISDADNPHPPSSASEEARKNSIHSQLAMPDLISNPGSTPTATGNQQAQAGFGNLFDWNYNGSGFAEFEQGAAGTGMTPNAAPYDMDLESMLAAFMPSRAPSPSSQLAKENNANTAPDATMWSQLASNYDYGGPVGNAYSGWMG